MKTVFVCFLAAEAVALCFVAFGLMGSAVTAADEDLKKSGVSRGTMLDVAVVAVCWALAHIVMSVWYLTTTPGVPK